MAFDNPIDEEGKEGIISIDESQYIKSTAWEIISKSGILSDRKYDCCPEIYQDITYRYGYQNQLGNNLRGYEQYFESKFPMLKYSQKRTWLVRLTSY